MELTWQGQRRKHGVLWVPTVTTQKATNALATHALPHPTFYRDYDHEAAVWLLLQGLMRRFRCLRVAFSLRFFLYNFRNFFSYMPPLPPTSILEILSNQCSDLNLLFYICAWSKHVRLRKRPITNQIVLPPWPLAVLSRICVSRANAPIHLKWLPIGLIMSENP